MTFKLHSANVLLSKPDKNLLLSQICLIKIVDKMILQSNRPALFQKVSASTVLFCY